MRIPVVIVAASLLGCVTTPDTLDAGSPASRYDMEMSGNRVARLTSPPIATTGTTSEIAARAQVCAARTLPYYDVTARGSTATLLGPHKENISVGAGQLIEAYDPANGLLVANTRVNYTAALIPYSAQARVTVETKDGRFRLSLNSLQYLQRDTGYASTDSFKPINRIFGTGWNAAVGVLTDGATKLSDCIVSPGDNW